MKIAIDPHALKEEQKDDKGKVISHGKTSEEIKIIKEMCEEVLAPMLRKVTDWVFSDSGYVDVMIMGDKHQVALAAKQVRVDFPKTGKEEPFLKIITGYILGRIYPGSKNLVNLNILSRGLSAKEVARHLRGKEKKEWNAANIKEVAGRYKGYTPELVITPKGVYVGDRTREYMKVQSTESATWTPMVRAAISSGKLIPDTREVLWFFSDDTTAVFPAPNPPPHARGAGFFKIHKENSSNKWLIYERQQDK